MQYGGLNVGRLGCSSVLTTGQWRGLHSPEFVHLNLPNNRFLRNISAKSWLMETMQADTKVKENYYTQVCIKPKGEGLSRVTSETSDPRSQYCKTRINPRTTPKH